MAKKILIADDEEMIRNLVKVSMQGEGYEFIEAKDGIEALEMAREMKPDLIILDVMMPGKVGYQVCTELKEDPATSDIVIIFLTARGGSLFEETVSRSGGDDYMVKPFDPRVLKEKVKKGLEE